MGWRLPDGLHVDQADENTSLGELPRSFATGKSAADNCDLCGEGRHSKFPLRRGDGIGDRRPNEVSSRQGQGEATEFETG